MIIELNLEQNSAIEAEIPVKYQDWQYWFATWIDRLIPTDLGEGAIDRELTLRLTDDAEIQALNAQYRQQDRPTDVLAFAALEADVPSIPLDLLPPEMLLDPIYLGDIVISVPTAYAQALARGHSHRWELAWLAAHGLLHLLGWDHPDEESLEQMLAEQEVLLQSVHLDLKFDRLLFEQVTS